MKNINKILALSVLVASSMSLWAKQITIGEPGKPGSMTFNAPETKQAIFELVVRYAQMLALNGSNLMKFYPLLTGDFMNLNKGKIKNPFDLMRDSLAAADAIQNMDIVSRSTSEAINKLKELYMAAPK